MELLARKMPLPYRMQDLVVPEALRLELELMAAWVRHRKKVLETWGFASRAPMGRGVSAVFTGAAGTGKTMAAQCLASELGMQLYRVDLAVIAAKFLPATEDSLGELFAVAGQDPAVLLFDEAEALFGGGGPRAASRRAEQPGGPLAGELLDRILDYEGVAILAAGERGRLDDAIARQLRFHLEFPVPGEEERLWIWEGMFPAEAERAEELNLAALARRHEVTGGEIRDAVLAAAFLAAAADQPIGMDHLERALRHIASRKRHRGKLR